MTVKAKARFETRVLGILLIQATAYSVTKLFGVVIDSKYVVQCEPVIDLIFALAYNNALRTLSTHNEARVDVNLSKLTGLTLLQHTCKWDLHTNDQ